MNILWKVKNMKNIKRGPAGLLLDIASVIAAVALLISIYAVLGTVDLVFMNGSEEVYRMEGVNMLSDIELPSDEVDENMEFTYVSGEETKDFGDPTEFKFHIAKTLVENLFSFKWEKLDHRIILTAK